MAVDYFLKLDGVDGESEDTNFKNQIQVLSFSWGASQVTSVSGSGGSGAGKADLSDFSIMKNYDKASPLLFKSILEGTHIATGTLSAVKSGAKGKPYLKIDFQEIFITSQQISASSEIPTESISFSYNQIKVDYQAQDEKGNLQSTGAVTWNTKTNTLS